VLRCLPVPVPAESTTDLNEYLHSFSRNRNRKTPCDWCIVGNVMWRMAECVCWLVRRQVCERIVESGRALSRSQRSSCPLMYEWHDKKYLGAAHGLVGILHTLLLACTSHWSESCIHYYWHVPLIGRNPAYITTGMYLSLVGILHTLLLACTSHWSESCIHYYWHVPLIGRNPAYITTGMYLSLVGILHTLLLACTSQYLSVLVLVYKVDLHWARLVVRWVTVDPVVNQVEGLFLSTPNDRFFTSRKYE